MAFFQNVFNQDFNGSFSDVSFRIGGNVNTSEVMDCGNFEPYNLSSDTTLTINFSLDKGLNFNPIAVNVSTGAISTSAVKAYEVVNALNNNTLFAAYYVAVANYNTAGQGYVTIRAVKPRLLMKSYVSNSSAEKQLKFNKRAPVAELPTYFARHVIGQQSVFSDSLGLLIQLDTGNAVDQAIITAAGLDYSSPKEDWQMLRGASNNYRFKKLDIDGSNRIVSVIEYFAGAGVGDQAIRTDYTYTSSNTNPDQITTIPIVLESGDLVTP